QSWPAAASSTSVSFLLSAGPGRDGTAVVRPACDCNLARLDSWLPGPHSNSSTLSWVSSVARQPPKRTGLTSWLAQYAGSVAAVGVIHSPVTLDRNLSWGGSSLIPSMTARNSASAGSIIGEWNACEVASRLLPMPSWSSWRANSVTSSAGPDTTQAPGPLT